MKVSVRRDVVEAAHIKPGDHHVEHEDRIHDR